jgi:hypothetical protein
MNRWVKVSASLLRSDREFPMPDVRIQTDAPQLLLRSPAHGVELSPCRLTICWSNFARKLQRRARLEPCRKGQYDEGFSP